MLSNHISLGSNGWKHLWVCVHLGMYFTFLVRCKPVVILWQCRSMLLHVIATPPLGLLSVVLSAAGLDPHCVSAQWEAVITELEKGPDATTNQIWPLCYPWSLLVLSMFSSFLSCDPFKKIQQPIITRSELLVKELSSHPSWLWWRFLCVFLFKAQFWFLLYNIVRSWPYNEKYNSMLYKCFVCSNILLLNNTLGVFLMSLFVCHFNNN